MVLKPKLKDNELDWSGIMYNSYFQSRIRGFDKFQAKRLTCANQYALVYFGTCQNQGGQCKNV